MALDLRDGVFRVTACDNGHVTLEVLEDGLTVFLTVMDRSEAVALARDLVLAAEDD